MYCTLVDGFEVYKAFLNMNLTLFWEPGTCGFAVTHFCNYILNGNLNKFKPCESVTLMQGVPPCSLSAPQHNSVWEDPTFIRRFTFTFAALPPADLSKIALEGTSEVT